MPSTGVVSGEAGRGSDGQVWSALEWSAGTLVGAVKEHSKGPEEKSGLFFFANMLYFC